MRRTPNASWHTLDEDDAEAGVEGRVASTGRREPNRWRWPHDYVSLDDGRLRVRPDFEPVFRSLGWLSAEAVLRSDRFQSVRRREERENARLALPRPGGEGELLAYAKVHDSAAVGPGRRADSVPPGLHEADAVGLCEAAGVPTMSVIAAGAVDRPAERRVHSLFISEPLEGALPADDFWKDRIGPPDAGAARDRRLSLLRALAEVAARLHEAGLFHRDLYWCHFFVEEPRPGSFHVSLIDLQRLHRPRRSLPRWRLKDLAQFVFSSPAGLVTREELWAWFLAYRRVERPSLADRLAFLAVRIRAFLYARKERRT